MPSTASAASISGQPTAPSAISAAAASPARQRRPPHSRATSQPPAAGISPAHPTAASPSASAATPAAGSSGPPIPLTHFAPANFTALTGDPDAPVANRTAAARATAVPKNAQTATAHSTRMRPASAVRQLAPAKAS